MRMVNLTIISTESFWYIGYVQNSLLEDERFVKKFCNLFWLPYNKFKGFSVECKASNVFNRWMSCNAFGQQPTPFKLLVLDSLRYLGRGWTVDDVEECTAVSQEIHRVSFGQFIEFGSIVLYNKYVVFRKNLFEEAKEHMKEFTVAGSPGLGGKSSSTTHLSRGGPGRWNDKAMILFDIFVKGIHDGNCLYDVEFELFKRSNGDIVTIKYRGGRYLRWSVTVLPYKVTKKISEIQWSKWVESMRKELKCAFGILKGLWWF
eukprot:CCRYP_008759-RA/>CCRYP_008759-RA protein AED:0.21 eAED:0.21 QI:0/0/0/1/0/0/2/0/259